MRNEDALELKLRDKFYTLEVKFKQGVDFLVNEWTVVEIALSEANGEEKVIVTGFSAGHGSQKFFAADEVFATPEGLRDSVIKKIESAFHKMYEKLEQQEMEK